MAKHVFNFINAAVSDDETRYFMDAAYFDKPTMRLVATDGRRLHWLCVTESEASRWGLDEAGYYKLDAKADRAYVDVIKTKANQFPNYAKVIPEYAPPDPNAVFASKEETQERKELIGQITLNVSKKHFDGAASLFIVKQGIALNYQYMKDLVLGADEWLAAFHPFERSKKAVHFVAKDNARLHAVIMPLSLD